MTQIHAQLLQSALPVDELWLRIQRKPSGFKVETAHRHHSGLFADCGWDLSSNLTLAELLDYVTAEVWLFEHGE